MTVRWGVIDGEMIVQFRDWVDGLRLCSAINIFAILGALGVGDSKDGHWEVVAVCCGANIWAFDVDFRVKTIERGDSEFAPPYQGKEGDSEAWPHWCVKGVIGVQFAEEHLDEC
jgi:hypothetical protein